MSFYDSRDFLIQLLDIFLKSKFFILVIFFLIILLVFFLMRIRKKSKFFNVCEIAVFNIKINVNVKNIDIAYKIYIQLKTRKIGIEFEENDVIIEVYDSWFTAFKMIRELLLSVRPTANNKELINVGMKILNQGMRPHLTEWQSKFRKWYDIEILRGENRNLSPQEIQRNYPEYKNLTKDIKNRQREILILLDKLEKIFM